MHSAVASALPDTEADRRAWHLALAAFGPDDAASSALEQAGQRAYQRSAYDVASRAFERAALLDQSVRHVSEPGLAVAIEHLRGHIAIHRGPVTGGQQILLAAAGRAAPVNPERAVVMLAEAAYASFTAGDAATMLLAAERVASLAAPDLNGRIAFFTLITRGMALIFSGQDEPGAPAVRQAVEVLERSDELRDEPRLLAWAAMGSIWLREADIGRALLYRALDAARRKSAIGALPFMLLHVAIDQAGTDRWAEAQAGFHEAIGLAREIGQHSDLALALAFSARLEARLGRSEQSRTHADEALSLSRKLDLGVAEVWAIAALGDLELGQGRPEAALAHFEKLRVVLRSRGILDADLSPVPKLVGIYLRLGRGPEAAKIAGDFTRDANIKGQPWALARAARCRGQLAAEGESDPHFETALALHGRTADAFETARTHLA